MNIFDYALKMEKDGESFYRQFAEKTSSKGLETIFTMLANEEVKHCQAIEMMRQDNYQMAETTVLDDVRNVFVELKDQPQKFESVQGQIELYKKAQEMEKESQLFYQDKARQTDKDEQKKLLNRLASEEKKHYFILENIIEFVSRPKQWLENAEWNHLEEY